MEAPLRTSSYLIPVKLESEPDKYMLIHGYTGAIDIVSGKLLNDIKAISSFNVFPKDLLDLLLKRGYITAKTQEEEETVVGLLAKGLAWKEMNSLKRFTLLVTYNCNFRCPYCYELNNLSEHKSVLISPNMCDRALKAISQIEPDSNLQKKTITLFGGEPLLKENKERIEYIVNEGRKYGFNFSAITNGYDLEQYTEFFSKDAINEIQVTIDGSKEVHDKRRVHINQMGTFDKIMKNVHLALERGIKVSIRINVDSANIDEVKKMNAFFQESGMYSYKNLQIYAAYIGGESNLNPSEYNEKIDVSNSSYDEFFNLFANSSMKLHHNYTIYNRLNYAVKNKKTIPLSSIHCEALYSNYVLDPLGNIYKCLDLVGNKNNVVGTYSGGSIKWNKNRSLWESRCVSDMKSCLKCKYALLCSGGCFSKIIQGAKSSCGDFSVILKKVCNEIYRKNEPLFIN